MEQPSHLQRSTTCWLSRFSSNSSLSCHPLPTKYWRQIPAFRETLGKRAGCCDTGPRDFKGKPLNSSSPCPGGSSCDGTAGAEGDENPPPHHLTPCSVSVACTEQLPHEKQRQRSLPFPVPEGLYPYHQALSLLLSLWLPFKHMTLPCSWQHLMVEIQDTGFVSVVLVSWWSPK